MTRPAPRLGTESKTFGQRVGAFLLDTLLVGAVFGVLSGLVAAFTFVFVADPTGPIAVNLAVLVLQSFTVVAGLGYFVLAEGKYGQTLGKRAVGLSSSPRTATRSITGTRWCGTCSGSSTHCRRFSCSVRR